MLPGCSAGPNSPPPTRWARRNSTPRCSAGTRKTIRWATERRTPCSEKAGAFYKQVFGWRDEPMPTPTVMGGAYTIFKKGEAQAGGMIKATPEMKLTHPYWLIYFAVDDCDKSVAKAKQLGGKAMLPPSDVPNIGRFSVLTDPQGAYFAIIAMKQ